VESVPRRRPGVRWQAYDAVVIRSTWDYTEDVGAFLRTLEGIERSGARLFNPPDLVRWNVRKTYLRDVARRGVPVVPTVWRECLRPGDLAGLLDEVGATEAVVKPVVGASAGGAFRLGRRVSPGRAESVEAYYADRPLLAQPFLPAVVTEGEYSLVYFDGAFSHAILKTPKRNDFRVQEEHGGLIRPVGADAALRAAGAAAVRAVDEDPLYARVDVVRGGGGGDGYLLMELELVEPALYFRTDRDAPARFARALHRRVTGRPATPRGSAVSTVAPRNARRP
jgi:glutathione synthase/RimK-type ligase-like ATP-grasp enzyme